MTNTPATQSEKRVIVALDVETAHEAREIVGELARDAGAFKIGLQLFTAAGPEFVREISAQHKVFLDLKFHDIPNTVAKAGIEAARLGVWMFNVHASGGSEMMRTTVDAVRTFCDRERLARPILIGVTVLTSSDTNILRESGIETEARAQVLRLARLTADSGLDGVVSSPMETMAIKSTIGRNGFIVVTPGVRNDSATIDDQKRVMTARQAVSEGSDYLVIGRPILKANDRGAALRRICEEINTAAQ